VSVHFPIARFIVMGAAIAGIMLAGGCTREVAGPSGTSLLPTASLAAHHFGNDAPWFEKNIPFFECSDPDTTRIYYYRWQLYKSHLKDLGTRGYIVTEFLDDVGWAFNPYQSLDDATGFHIHEGRWLKSNRYLDDYITFMYSGANDRHFSDAIAAAVYARYLANGDRAFATMNLEGMKRLYESWADHYDPARGLYYIEPLVDATEYSIASIDASGGRDGFRGGDAFRPTINSFMYGNAMAISRLAGLAGDPNTERLYAAKAAALRDRVQKDLWNDDLRHFSDRYKVSNEFVHNWDFIRGRELAGYVPWYYGLPDDAPKYNAAWGRLLSPDGFAGAYGLRTVEPGYEYYMKQYRYAVEDGRRLPECQWNGPSWPFDTTLVLGAMANLLNDYTQDVVKADDYVRLLKQYARQHYLDGQPDLQEDYDPDRGKVIVGLARSHHYNHSAFNDLVITGLVGLRPRADNVLEINPLVVGGIAEKGGQTPGKQLANGSQHSQEKGSDPVFQVDYFCLENVPYHGQLVTIVYDRDGRRYRKGAGLSVYVNGRMVLPPSPLGRQTIPIPEPVVTTASHPIDLAVNHARKGFPAPDASINTSAGDIYQAVDGRVWFWPDVRNYWTNAGSKARQDWFSLDFGEGKRFSSARLHFYADGVKFKAPRDYTLQYWRDGNWVEVPGLHKTPRKPLANGDNTLAFRSVAASRVRVLFTNPADAAIALVGVELFGD
jgi:hypothetical protein